MTYPSDNTQGFASLLYVMFVLEKRYSVKEVAPQLDVAPSTLYDYVRGARVFPPDLIAPLYNATEDRRVLAFFLDECGVAFHPLPEPCRDLTEELFREALVAQEEFCDVLRAVRESVRDGRVDRRELARIEAEYSEAQGALAHLVACVRAEAMRRRS